MHICACIHAQCHLDSLSVMGTLSYLEKMRILIIKGSSLQLIGIRTLSLY